MPRPLLVGLSVLSVKDSLVIMGGSAVCFSFGNFWNKGCFTISTMTGASFEAQVSFTKLKDLWKYEATVSAMIPNAIKLSKESLSNNSHLSPLARLRVQSSEEFARVVEQNKPVILEGFNLGPCTDLWTPDYLKAKLGTERKVSSICNYQY